MIILNRVTKIMYIFISNKRLVIVINKPRIKKSSRLNNDDKKKKWKNASYGFCSKIRQKKNRQLLEISLVYQLEYNE